ncbi:MAG: transporter [Prevotella sp.]|nr:transporter [Prevotella sp.]
MKRLVFIFVALLTVFFAKGQELPDTFAYKSPCVPDAQAHFQGDILFSDSLHLPPFTQYGRLYNIGMYPYGWGGLYQWNLHQGLNVSLGASVFAQFGKHAHHGAGFSQNVSMMYADTITNKLSFAIGGYLSNLSWAHDTYRDAGLNAVLGYKFNDRWEAYLYGQKSLVKTRMPLPLYDVSDIGDRIGAAVKYNVSPNFSIQLNVEKRDYDVPVPDFIPDMPNAPARRFGR